MTDDYSEHPKSITEIKSEKSGDAANWTPRDALISILRRLDAGEFENVDALIVAFRDNKGETTKTHFANAGPNIHTAFGVLEAVKQLMWHGEG